MKIAEEPAGFFSILSEYNVLRLIQGWRRDIVTMKKPSLV
jgi:hypothetical protein